MTDSAALKPPTTDEIREALQWWLPVDQIEHEVAIGTLQRAARCWLDFLENGPNRKHWCEDIEDDDLGFKIGTCYCGWKTDPAPSDDIVCDQLMGHAVDVALARYMETE